MCLVAIQMFLHRNHLQLLFGPHRMQATCACKSWSTLELSCLQKNLNPQEQYPLPLLSTYSVHGDLVFEGYQAVA